MWSRTKARILDLWRTLRLPSRHYSLGFLTVAGFIAGILFWGGFNTALEATNTEAFCTSCHEMQDNVFEELKTTIHYSNRSGVRATCPDCHVPHNWTDKIARKMQASKEVWGKIFGTINTREKFLDERLILATHEWNRLKANDGPHPAGLARRAGAQAVAGHRQEDLHRLPQGRGAPPARHDRRAAGMTR